MNDLPVTDFSTVASDGDTVYIKLVPEGGDTSQTGGAMKGVGGMMVIFGVMAMFLGPVGIGIGAALIGAGIGMFASGTVLYNMDTPGTPKEREQPEQDPSIRGSENQSRPLGTIPTLLGRRRIYPDLAATSYTWVDKNGHQYLYQLFCLGQAEQEVDTATLKIDETLLADYSATGDISQVLAGTDELIDVTIHQGGETPPMMTKCVHEEQLNAILKNKTEEGQDASIVRTTPDKTEEIHLDIFFYNGLGRYDSEGDVVSASVQLEALYKRSDQENESYQSLGTFSYGSNTITGKELKTKRYTIHKTGLPPASYTVKVSRITPDSEDNKVVDAVYVGSIRSLKGEAPVSPERCRLLTLMAVRIRVSEKLNSVIKKLNVESQARLPSWSGTGTGLMGWPYSKSSNPASAMVYAMTGGFSQQKLKDSEIDWTSLQRLYQWCQDKGYECNEYVSESMPISSLLTRIASTCRSEVVRMNGRITVIQDIERPAPVQLFTPRNSHGYTESIIMADLPDAMSLQYTDEEAGFAKNELTIYNTTDGNKEREPETTQDVPLWGVTSSVQARKLGMYKYAVSKNRPIVAKFSCDFEYLLCNKGDRIRYAGDIALTGISQGRIAGLVRNTVGQIIAVTTDEALPMEAGKTYGMRIRGQDGSIVLHQLVTEIGEFKEAVFAASVGEGEVAEGDLFSFGLLDNDSKEFIITEISCGENLSADITCTEYAPEIFAVDDPGFTLPDYDPKITNVPAVMDGGNITLSNWQTWFTYHDQFNLPPKPTGDGSSNGWHRLATAQSMWVSSKTARTISDGEWSEPYSSSGLALDKLMNGTGIGAPDAPVIESVTAEQNGINITITPPVGNINNLSVRYTVELTKNSSTTIIESTSLSAVYSFDRKVDGYPEASDLSSWRVRVKAVNVYGKESPWSDEAAIDTSNYLTWKVAAPRAMVKADRDWLDWGWTGVNMDVYGTVVYDLMAGDRVLAVANENSYRYRFDRDVDGYPEKSDLLSMGLKVRARNEAHAAEYTLEELDLNLRDYLTWIPKAVAVRAAASETKIDMDWGEQAGVYGSFTYDITIDGRTVSRTTAHFDWYEFNRLVDGYPEKNDLAGWVCSLKIANEVRSIAVPFSIDTSRYLTWIPSITEFSVVASEDMVRTDWKDNSSDCYGVFRYTVSRDGVPVRSSMTQPPLNIGYNRDVDGYPEKDWFTHKYTLTVENQAHKVVSAETPADTTDYLTWKITPPAATATASEGEIALSWSGKSAGTYYGTPAYSVLVDGQKVAEGITSLEYTWQFDPEDRGWPEAADIDGWNIVLRAETEADSADVAVTVDTSAYLGYMPKAAPIARAEANGRLITVSWPRDTSVYGYTGAEVQVAKAYKLAGDVYTPITDEAELVWMKPAVGLNPYVSEDNYQDGTGSLVVARETVSLMVPLHGQATAPVPETMYAYRVATTTSKSSSPWTAPIYVIARPVSAGDVVKAWNITDTGEKVKVDGALGANQIYVHDLAAISANLGMITDGMIAGSELNYWAINDVVDERGLISRFRGEWRVGDEEEYIQVSVRTDELGNPIPGRYKIKIAAGEYVVFAGDTEIHGKTFTFFDTEGNVIFQITPQSSYIAVKTGRFVSNYSRTAIQGLHPYAYQYGSFITQNKGETIYRRLYQDTHGVSRTGFFRVASGGDQLLDQLPSTLPCHQMCFQNGDKLYTMWDMLGGLDYTNYRFGLLDGSGTVFPDPVLGVADRSNQGFFCPDRSAGWRRVSTVLETREDYSSWYPTGDGHLFRVIDNEVQVVSTLSGIQWKLSGILVKSAKYIGNHHILGTNTDGSIRRVWNLKDTSYFDLQLDEGDTPVYVVSPGNIWAKDADGQVWHYDAAGRTAASIRLESTPYIVAESYGTSVWWEVSQSIVRLNVLDGSSDEAEIPQDKWSVRIPTANYIVMINDSFSSMVLVGKWRLDKQTTMSLDTLQAFMPAGGDLVVQTDAMYNQAWVQLGEGADGNPEVQWLDPPVQMSLPTIVNHDIDLEAMTWTRNTFAFPSTKAVIPITGLSDNDKRLWTDGEHLYEQDGSALNNLGTIPLDSDAVPTGSFDLYAHQGYIYILKVAELATVVTRVHQATLDVSYAALPLAAADPMNPYPCVLRDGMLWVALKGNVLSNTQDTLFPEELDLLARAELGGLRWFGTLDEIQIGYSEVDVWTIQSMELTLIPTAGDGPYLGAVGLDKSDGTGATTWGLLVAAMEADSPQFSTWARYHGQADLIQTGMDIVPPGASCGIHEGVMVIAGYHYNLDTASATHMIGQHNISSPETLTGREVYETGVGFKSVFYDKLSGHYRYYMDTGACIEFDEDGNLISKGQEGAPGRDGLPGTKGEQGKGIQSTIPHYLASDLKTGVTYATPGWTTAPQQTTDSKKFLWNYLEFAYTDGTTVRTNPVVIGGEKGDRGEDGENAVISGVTATVDSGVGTPSVDVTMGGTELDRTFSFAFKNLKGNTGATGPQGPQGPKGDKGDTGATGPSVLKSFTMNSLGFTGGQDSVVQLVDFLSAIRSKLGTGGIALCSWSNANSAKVTDGTTTISINGGHVVWGSTNAFPTSTWSTVTATYYPSTDGSAWKMSAIVSGTAGTVTYKKIIAIHAPAINHVYIQFRGQSAPTTLYPRTSWQNISSTYAGRFFRAEGGDAAAFGSQQAGGLPEIQGYFQWATNPPSGRYTRYGAFYGDGTKRYISANSGGEHEFEDMDVNFKASYHNSIYGAASEVRPVNEAFRIWKRIS